MVHNPRRWLAATLSNLMEYLVRFLAGGIVVSAFAVLGDVLRPKSFAGLFGAVPSVALATLSLALWKEGGDYVSIEGHSMILGALALAAYSLLVCQLLMRARWSALAATTTATLLWLAIALGSKQLLIG
jgi:hydrogenase-4 membrane subunit HyfE